MQPGSELTFLVRFNCSLQDHAPRKGGWDLSGDNAAAKDAPTRPTRMRTGYESDEDKYVFLLSP